MRPVDQTAYGISDGNCFSACVASILEMSIEAVPSFVHVGPHWWFYFLDWLADRGLAATHYEIGDAAIAPRGLSIAGGPSLRFAGLDHTCVALDGVVVHDPHPSRDGLPFGADSYVVIHAPDEEPTWINGLK